MQDTYLVIHYNVILPLRRLSHTTLYFSVADPCNSLGRMNKYTPNYMHPPFIYRIKFSHITGSVPKIDIHHSNYLVLYLKIWSLDIFRQCILLCAVSHIHNIFIRVVMVYTTLPIGVSLSSHYKKNICLSLHSLYCWGSSSIIRSNTSWSTRYNIGHEGNLFDCKKSTWSTKSSIFVLMIPPSL